MDKNENTTYQLKKMALGDFPSGACGEESTYQGRRYRRHWFDSWVRKIPPEEEMATHSSIIAWKMLWTEEPGRLQSMESQRDTTEPNNKTKI